MNVICFSGLFAERFPEIYKILSSRLKFDGIKEILLEHTKDIWCRDYMPLQVGPNEFVQFKYAPSYLKAKKWRDTITNPALVCAALGIKPVVSDIVVDGGNVVRYGSKVIMTERVLKENPCYEPEVLAGLLKGLLKAEELILIPEEPWDPFGHADGGIHFLNEGAVIINEPQEGNLPFARKLRCVLRKHGLSWVEMPCFVDDDPAHKESAVGNYINFLEYGDTIIIPSYEGHEEEDHRAIEVLVSLHGSKRGFTQVDATHLAKLGGVLNCVSWCIKD